MGWNFGFWRGFFLHIEVVNVDCLAISAVHQKATKDIFKCFMLCNVTSAEDDVPTRMRIPL